MSNIDFKDLTISEEEFSSIDLSDILDLVTKGDYKKASDLSLQKIEAGFFDIRLISYYLFGLCYSDFETQGEYVFQSFSEVFAKFDNLKPVKYKEKQCQNALNWFLASLMDRLEFRESKGSRLIFSKEISETYQGFETSVSDALGKVDETAIKLRRFILDRIQVEVPEEAAKETPAGELPEEVRAQFDTPVLEASNSFGGSQKWQSLLDKLKVLDVLQSQEAEVEAAVLYRHIYHLLSSFNPLEYFPEHLAPFYQKTLDPNFQNIIDKTESHIASVQWTALESLVASDHRLLLNGQCGLSETSKSVAQEKFHSLIETDQYRNTPPQPDFPSPHTNPMAGHPDMGRDPFAHPGAGMPPGGMGADPYGAPGGPGGMGADPYGAAGVGPGGYPPQG